MSNKKLLLILTAILLVVFGGYSFLSKRNKSEPAALCGESECAEGCCVSGKCQPTGMNIAGYTCLGENNWQNPDKSNIIAGSPYAVLDAVSGRSFQLDEVDPATVVATVGQERIFQIDLESELAFYPPKYNPDIRELILEKIGKDSELLQQASGEGLVILDETVFDSADKDYQKRLAMVAEIREIFDKRDIYLSGSIVSIWFYNEKAGPLGYEKSKELAFNKISALHQNVKNGIISLEEAIEAIKNDSTLTQIDPSYRANASFRFEVKTGEKISLDPGFDRILWQLDEGEISDIYLAKDAPFSDSETVDALFMFARIDKKQITRPTGITSL